MPSVVLQHSRLILTHLVDGDIFCLSTMHHAHDMTLRFKREQAQELSDLLKGFLEIDHE